MAALVPSAQAIASSRGRRALEYLLWFNSAILPIYYASAVPAAFIPEDLQNPIQQRVIQQPETPPNLLLTTLVPQQQVVVVTQQPFSQEVWETPVKRAFRDLTWTQNSIVQKKFIQPPFSQTDWINPQKTRWYDGTWTQEPQQIAAEVVVQLGTPFNTVDFPNPRVNVPRETPQFVNNLVLIPIVQEVASTEKPFAQAEWTNPSIAKTRNISLLWFNSAILPKTDATAPSSTEKPFSQTDWQNPNRRGPFRDLTWTQTPQEITPSSQFVVPPPPFSQEDWPNPHRRGPFRDLTWFDTPQTITPSSPEAAPALDVVFREALVSPPIRRIKQREWGWTQSSFVGGIPAAATPPRPFNQEDWPNPILRVSFRDLTWTQTPEVIPQVVIPTPFSQEDWPNPKLRTPFRDQTWLQTPFIGAVPTAQAPSPPFYETEHPNPVLRVSFRDLTWTQTPYISGIPENLVPVVPPVADELPKPSGGWVREFKDAIEGRYPRDVVRVITSVAERQVEALQFDEQKQFEELERELEVEDIAFEAEYLDALNDYRRILIDTEIQRLMQVRLNKVNAALLLILLASID